VLEISAMTALEASELGGLKVEIAPGARVVL
jgi:hypothetical protein